MKNGKNRFKEENAGFDQLSEALEKTIGHSFADLRMDILSSPLKPRWVDDKSSSASQRFMQVRRGDLSPQRSEPDAGV